MYRHYDSTIRRLLARGLRHQQPADFDRIHRSAAEYYQLEARRATYLHHHLVSALYHLAQAHRSEGPAAVGERCLRWVQERSKSWIGADWNAVARAWQTGAGDVTVVDELKELIGSEVYVQITQLLKTANQTVEVLL
jgi:hypothetical protein